MVMMEARPPKGGFRGFRIAPYQRKYRIFLINLVLFFISSLFLGLNEPFSGHEPALNHAYTPIQKGMRKCTWDQEICKAILMAARHFDLDPLLIEAIIYVESGFDTHAVSPKGAVGLMQVHPKTVRFVSQEELKNPTKNIMIGAEYLRLLLDEFDGSLELALAAYNAGIAKVKRYNGVPPFNETRAYIRKILEYVEEPPKEL